MIDHLKSSSLTMSPPPESPAKCSCISCPLPTPQHTWTRTLPAIAEASTELIICRNRSSWLVPALLLGQDRDCDSLQGAGVWSSFMDTKPAPSCHCGQGAWGEVHGGGGQADGPNSGGGFHLGIEESKNTPSISYSLHVCLA